MQTKGNRRRGLATTGITVVILGPLWGFLVMGLSRYLELGPVADYVSFYLMVAGWLVMPVGVLLLLYRLAVGTIMNQRLDEGR